MAIRRAAGATAWHCQPPTSFAIDGDRDDLRREPDQWQITRRRIMWLGTGLCVGNIARQLRPIFEGAIGRLPEWP